MHSVMVVDDDPTLRRVVTSWVESFGYEATESESAADAVERLADEPVDIAVCDVTKSAKSGVWLASEIREHHPQTAIIMASRLRDVDVAVSSLRNDVVDYLLKPFDRARLGE